MTNNVIGSSVGTIIGVLFGIDATNANVTNHADIVATGAGGTAIHATGTATVSNTNSSTVLSTVTADSFGINAGTVIVNANNGRIEATGTNGVAINAATDVTVTSNTGTISSEWHGRQGHPCDGDCDRIEQHRQRHNDRHHYWRRFRHRCRHGHCHRQHWQDRSDRHRWHKWLCHQCGEHRHRE